MTFPLSYAQQRLWFFDQIEPNSAAYNMPFAWRLKGTWEKSSLEKGLNTIIQRHEVLRTVFRQVDGSPVQVIEEFTVPLNVVDLRHFENGERDVQISRYMEEEAHTPFDLAKGPLLRTKLLHIGEEEYIFLFTIHHIVFDGWSMDIFIDELLTVYEAEVHGKTVILAPLEIQYVDYALWQREWLTDKVMEEQLRYWKDELSGELPVLQLPTDRPRPVVQSYKGNMYRKQLSVPLLNKLKVYSRKEGTTLFMTLLAAYQGFLSRYTGQKDILVGCAVANRNHKEVEGLIGSFINTLVYRADVSRNPSFKELLTQVKEKALRAQDYQDVPFDKVVEEVQPERSTSHSPLFQTMFSLESGANHKIATGDRSMEAMGSQMSVAKFDLSILLTESEEEFQALYEYNTDLFDRSTIERLAEHFHNWLMQIVDYPEQSIESLKLMDEAEEQKLLVEWNKTEVIFPENKCLHELFMEQVKITPDHVAVVFEDEVLTYKQLDISSNKFAQYLSSLGVKPNVPVGLHMDRSIDLVISIIGIIKAGGVFLPLDTELPVKRVNQLLENSKCKVCVTQERYRKKFIESEDIEFIYVEADEDRIKEMSEELPKSNVTSDDLISIYYTSGSTGTPKGVANVHKGWVNRMNWMQRKHQLKIGETVLQKTTLTFDDAAVEIFWPIIVGGKIALIGPDLHRDPQEILNAAIKYDVSFITFVPSMLEMFLDEITDEHRDKLKNLKNVNSSGEALLPETVKKFYNKLNATLHNTWGATEVSIDSTIHTCTLEDQHEPNYVSVGRPIDNNKIYILDKYMRPVPIGVVGDLYIGGIGLAAGYINNCEKTNEVFIQNPFVANEKIYRTGDKGFYKENGDIQFIGREDSQFKIRGMRVELGEIESILRQNLFVKNSVVIAKKIEHNYQLIAYVVPNDSVVIESKELREFLKERLPNYMVPDFIVILDNLPFNSNGKVDTNSLPLPDDFRININQEFVQPKSQMEIFLAEIWKSVLKIDEVGIHDSFFDLGGHSLLATQVIARIRRKLGISLSVNAFFEKQSIYEISIIAEAMLVEKLNLMSDEEASELLLQLNS